LIVYNLDPISFACGDLFVFYLFKVGFCES